MDCPRCQRPVAAGVRRCKACGATIPLAQSLLAEAGFSGDGEAVGGGAASGGGAAPAATPARIMRGANRLATIGDRLLATILDSILLFAVFMVASFWAASLWGGLTEGGLTLGFRPFLAATAITLPFAFLYFSLLECMPGATVGKLIMGLDVRREDGTRLDLRASAIRTLWRAVDGIAFYLVGFFVAIFSRMRQRLGDHMAHSAVLERPASEWRQGLMVLVWVMVLIAATLASGKIYSDSSISSQSTEPAHSMLRMNWSANGISLRALHLEVSLNWSSVPRRTEQAYQPEQPK